MTATNDDLVARLEARAARFDTVDTVLRDSDTVLSDRLAGIAVADAALDRAAASRIKALEEALAALTKHYVSLVNSGDAGNWDPEKEPVVIAARSTLQGSKP